MTCTHYVTFAIRLAQAMAIHYATIVILYKNTYFLKHLYYTSYIG